MKFDVSSGTIAGGLACALALTLVVTIPTVEIGAKACHLHHGRPCAVEQQHIHQEAWTIVSS